MALEYIWIIKHNVLDLLATKYTTFKVYEFYGRRLLLRKLAPGFPRQIPKSQSASEILFESKHL